MARCAPKSVLLVVLTVVAAATVVFPQQAAAASGPHTLTYSGRTSGTSCGTIRSITYYTPSQGAGPFPLLVWLPGTVQDYAELEAQQYLRYMADGGFVAASIQYDNDFDLSDTSLTQKAGCVFDPGSSTSAIGRLSQVDSVDVAKGIFVSGLSQGALVANLSKNVDAGVRAAWLTGVGDRFAAVNYPAQRYSNTALEHIRATNGQLDPVFGTQYCLDLGSSNAMEVEHVTGVDAGTPCWPDTRGAGNTDDVSWYVVPGLEHIGIWYTQDTQPCSTPWSRCAIRAWAQTQVQH